MNHPSDPRLGQVFTPAPVADLVLALALEGGARTVLDPACGDGVFLERAVAAGIAPAALSGWEVDPAAAAAARARVAAARVITGDFLGAAVAEFDAVVGNPPYVRQELLSAAVKRRIARRLAEDWPDVARFAGRADLAMAFVARALRFVRPGGRVGFVLSAAALDAGYGAALRELLRGRAELLAVVASPRERWFAGAAIHAVIVVLERAGAGALARAARFARLRIPVADAARRVRGVTDLEAVAEVRTLPPGAAFAEPWGPLLRAPAAWFDVAAAAGDALVPLGELAEVRRGVTSGANAFFYLTRAAAVRRGIEARFLRPVLKTPRHAAAIRVTPSALPAVAFVCTLDRRALRAHPGAAAHVRAHAHLAARPSLVVRDPWWSLAARPARLFLSKAYDTRFVQYWSPEPIVADQRVYTVTPRGRGGGDELLAAALNGTLTALALESLGRASMGEGALEWSVADAERLPVLDPRRADAGAVLRAFRALASRAIGPVDREVDAADRRALDVALVHRTPALADLMASVRTALVDAVAERVARSCKPL